MVGEPGLSCAKLRILEPMFHHFDQHPFRHQELQIHQRLARLATHSRNRHKRSSKGIHRVNYTTRNGQNGCSLKPESEWHYHEVERLVSDDVWDECNHLIDESYSKQKRPAKKPVHVFAGVAHCACGEKMYVPSNSPKYVCRACRNKISIADLDAIFCEEIKGFSLSPQAVADYLKSSNETAVEKEHLLVVQREELQRVKKEIQRTNELYQQEKLDADGFAEFYAPLNERKKQIEATLPRLEAELNVLKVNNLSAEEIATQAASLYDRWQTMPPNEKREMVELITQNIVIAKDEITISLSYSPSCKDMANRWRKGWDSNGVRGFFQNPLLRNYHPTTRCEQPHN